MAFGVGVGVGAVAGGVGVGGAVWASCAVACGAKANRAVTATTLANPRLAI